jgi:signal transduction histidine kinase
MRWRFSVLTLFVLASLDFKAQNPYVDSLKREFATSKDDTSRSLILSDLSYYSRYTDIDTSLVYAERALTFSRRIGFLRGESRALGVLSLAYRDKGDLPKSIDLQFKSLRIAESNNYIVEKADCYRRIGVVYGDLRDYSKNIAYCISALTYHAAANYVSGEIIDCWVLGSTYLQLKNLDSAWYFAEMGHKKEANYDVPSTQFIELLQGRIQLAKGNRDSAMAFFNSGIPLAKLRRDYDRLCDFFESIAGMYRQSRERDSAIHYATESLKHAQWSDYRIGIISASKLLSELYDTLDTKQSLLYARIASNAKDSLFGAADMHAILDLISNENLRQNQVEATQREYNSRLKQIALSAGLGAFLIVSIILFRNSRQKQKANKILESTVANLKSTQAQLVQSEKMASLGEITAGIAHEIQNPLNFINNFAQVNEEFIAEAEEAIDKGRPDDVKQILKTLSENEKKINQHGQRADSIVKGMLQHSRSSTGQKEPTDINALIDEYLRLSYHGWKAKDKSVHINLQKTLDPSIKSISVVSQDLGRVILNLCNNAFYAVSEKKKTQPDTYEPTVEVCTARADHNIEIKIKDNGNGIPDAAIKKIFQPFFTTKPAGQGTGLGLSLTYDIIKAQGGEISVETKEGQGSEFTIQFPVTQEP